MKASTLGADMLCGWCACSPADQIFCISQVWTKWRWTEDQTIQFTRDEGFWRKSTVFVLQLKKAEIKLKFWTNEVLCWNFIIRRCQNNRKSLPLFNSGKQMAIRGSEKYTVYRHSFYAFPCQPLPFPLRHMPLHPLRQPVLQHLVIRRQVVCLPAPPPSALSLSISNVLSHPVCPEDDSYVL